MLCVMDCWVPRPVKVSRKPEQLFSVVDHARLLAGKRGAARITLSPLRGEFGTHLVRVYAVNLAPPENVVSVAVVGLASRS